MVEIPIVLKLRKEGHKEIARAQDLLIEEVYRVFEDAVLHGGTAIWRCYKGNRFSEDLDFYLNKDNKKIEALFENLRKNFVIEKRKISENSLFSVLNFNGTIIRFEAIFKKVKGELKEYEKADGNLISIYTLSAEELIKEKADAYLKRLKIRDLYDVFFLLRYADKTTDMNRLIKNFKKPVDENELKVLIIEGLIPSVEGMLNYIRKWEKKST